MCWAVTNLSAKTFFFASGRLFGRPKVLPPRPLNVYKWTLNRSSRPLLSGIVLLKWLLKWPPQALLGIHSEARGERERERFLEEAGNPKSKKGSNLGVLTTSVCRNLRTLPPKEPSQLIQNDQRCRRAPSGAVHRTLCVEDSQSRGGNPRSSLGPHHRRFWMAIPCDWWITICYHGHW